MSPTSSLVASFHLADMAARVTLFLAAVILVSVAVVEGAAYKTKIVGYEDGVGAQTSFYSESGKAVTGTPTAGDTFTWLWTFRSTSNAKVGTVTGTCLYTTSTVNICTITYRLTGGSITVSGAQDDNMNVNEFAVAGGTGKYAGANGYLKSTTITSTPGKQKYKDEFYLM